MKVIVIFLWNFTLAKFFHWNSKYEDNTTQHPTIEEPWPKISKHECTGAEDALLFPQRLHRMDMLTNL
jgi:hypothetical protein